MYLSAVYVRFYKSFNFDYLRKYDRHQSTEHPWEKMDGMFYPYVRIPIDNKITTVVGANESGKTHLLTAIEKGLSGESIKRDDFCRYSQFFTVEKGSMRWPDFGFEWSELSTTERATIADACNAQGQLLSNRFLVFRNNRTEVTAYFPSGNTYAPHVVHDHSALFAALPSVFRLRENVALPESVPIQFLAQDVNASDDDGVLPRAHRMGLIESVMTHLDWFQSKESVGLSADKISREIGRHTGAPDRAADGVVASRVTAERQLAHDLIRKVARVDPEALGELFAALKSGRDAFANSVVDKINDTLRTQLNFPRWWVQDREFQLLVSPREYDLAFTIRDRTEREYAFGERSSGLRYFLSYYIQYRAHEPPGNRPEILLMDEPDAYLSNQGQQDLLKIFDAFANPDDKTRSSSTQVLYVTHSPFLIDKNHGERIRVLDKGVGEEGTRVVRDASRNHYEPLRSAFGSFVGETTFMGNCNLIVEGQADQILLAGASSYLRSANTSELENIDLNRMTIVPAGGAPHVPYLVYLARGRDVEKPAVLVLLDSDPEGDEARAAIRRGGPKRKQILKPEYVTQIGDLSKEASLARADGKAFVELEDLIPLGICVLAVRRYLEDVCSSSQDVLESITENAIIAEMKEGIGVFGTIRGWLTAHHGDLHIEKVGFARAVVESVRDLANNPDNEASQTLRQMFESHLRTLFARIQKMQRAAERELTTERVSARISRAVNAFLQDRTSTARREHAFLLFEELEQSLDNTAESDQIRLVVQSLRRDFKIDEEPTAEIDDFGIFRERLERLRYTERFATQSPTLQEVTATRAPRAAVEKTVTLPIIPSADSNGKVDSSQVSDTTEPVAAAP
jgi:hypothetical protein